MPPRQGPAASQPSCPFLLVLLFLCLLALDRVHASDSREDKLLRSDEVAPLCPCAADAAQIQKKQQVNLFMMSKNSRGASAILALAPLVRSHPNLNVSFAFIASLDNNGTFHSLDGAEEVQGDLWELCAIKHFQDGLKYLDFLVCFSQQYAEIPAQAVNCSINSSLDLGIMYDCVEGTEGQDLLSASIQSVNAAGLSGSESDSVIFINGKRYEGPSTRMSIEEAICSGESVVVGDDKIYEQWWFYFLLALGVVGGVAILIAGVITAYRVYVKCHRASDMWLNMIKSNPGNALDFADKVQDAMHRYDGSGGGLRVSRERGMEEGHAAGGGGGGGGPYVYSAGGAIGPYSVNQHPSHSYTTSASAGVGSRVYAEVDHGEEEEEEDEDYYSSPDDGLEAGGMPSGRYYAEESPLLSGLGNTWSMGGVRD